MLIRRCQLATLLAAAALFVGCRQAPPHYRAVDARPLVNQSDGSARSLASDSDAMTKLAYTPGPSDAWYLDRRDYRPSVQAGYVSAQHEITVTYTRDSQYISGGQAYDRYRQTTYRRSIRESQR